MRPAKKTSVLLALAAALAWSAVTLPAASGDAPAGHASASAPAHFFGIVPQTEVTDDDVRYMRAARIGSIRVPLIWYLAQPAAEGGYDWSGFDRSVEVAARGGLRVLPFIYGTPRWLAGKPTTLPVGNGRQRRAWATFVRAAVERYGPRGEFWREHGPLSAAPLPKRPIRAWQIWNEANFFYFAFPVSPTRYARLLKLTQPAIKQADRGAEVILSGLFGDPDEGGRRGMDAADFLDRLYRVPGIKAKFDSIALHPYAFHVDDLEALTEKMREVAIENRDRRARLYVTELGWGSQYDPNVVAFEQGIHGQARELRNAYRYLIDNRHRLNVKGAYWFSWKDVLGACNFCDSVGLFRRGERFRPKRAWHVFVRITGGRPRP